MRQESDYSNSCVYSLESEDGLYKYIGATCNLHRRKNHHSYRCNNSSSEFYNYKVYKTIRDISTFEDFRFVILENVNCENVKQLRAVEKKYIDDLQPLLNTYSVGKKRKNINAEKKIRNRL